MISEMASPSLSHIKSAGVINPVATGLAIQNTILKSDGMGIGFIGLNHILMCWIDSTPLGVFFKDDS